MVFDSSDFSFRPFAFAKDKKKKKTKHKTERIKGKKRMQII